VSDHAVQIGGLRVRAGSRLILDIASLSVNHGQMLGLLGPNGAGKSTLLRCLLGTQPGAGGDVFVLDEPVLSLSWIAAARLRRRIGYVPQLPPGRCELPLTVREVVSIGRTGIAGLLRPLGPEDRQIIDEWLDRLELSHLAGRGFAEISGGEQRKTLIARAMVQQPQLLLLDEPTAHLDLGSRERIVRIIDGLYRTTRVTVILVCHELEVLPPSCGRTAVLLAGRLIADGPPAEVLTTQLITTLYGGGLDVVRQARRWAVVPGDSTNA